MSTIPTAELRQHLERSNTEGTQLRNLYEERDQTPVMHQKSIVYKFEKLNYLADSLQCDIKRRSY